MDDATGGIEIGSQAKRAAVRIARRDASRCRGDALCRATAVGRSIREVVSGDGRGGLRAHRPSAGQAYQEQKRPYAIERLGEGYVLRLLPKYVEFLKQRAQPERGVKLARPVIEVLSIIAYRQPIGRQAIEELTGGDASGPLRQLCAGSSSSRPLRPAARKRMPPM